MSIYAVYKPKGPTSHDVIDSIRKKTGVRTVGHAGTLDPLASGVLVIGVGREATRKLSDFVGKEKEYIADVRLGVESTTDDEEGEKTMHNISVPPLRSDIEILLKNFIGRIEQMPPIYSALKIRGKSAYKYARKGLIPQLKARTVEIKDIEILGYDWPNLRLRVVTGPGVYIRALARDIGRFLKTGAYLSDLERTRVGDFNKNNALSIDSIPVE